MRKLWQHYVRLQRPARLGGTQPNTLKLCSTSGRCSIQSKSIYAQIQRRDPHRIPVTCDDQGEAALTSLELWASMSLDMRARPNIRRHQQLTSDTGLAANHTLNGLAQMSKYVLNLPPTHHMHHQYVRLGFFQQDDLEHHFGHFRRSAGCNYYISVRDIMNTHNIDRTKLMLEMDMIDLAKTQPNTLKLC